MLSDKKNRLPPKVTMILSMVLLLCFLGYFLWTEYDKAKETIELEIRERTFKKIFDNDITADTVQNKLTSKIDDYLKEVMESDSLDKGMSKGDTSTRIVVSYDVKKTEDHILNDSSTFKELGLASEITVIKITDENEKISYAIKNVVVQKSQVFKRIIPQFLFSILLFAIVFYSFYRILKSLTKEKELSQLRNELVTNMSHELKTPVSTISVALEALSSFDAKENPTLRKEYIDISRSEIKRLGMLIDKTLNINLFEQGRFKYEMQDMHMDQEVENILQTLKVQLDQQKVKIDFKKSGNNFLVKIDKTHMTNVIHNLIENAIKYSQAPRKIEIHLNESSTEIEIRIKDNGIGIPDKYQSKVFDKFFRVPQGDAHNYKGHGLGLSYVQQVISAQGGKISLDSEEGVGSKFSIHIPKLKVL